jgi:hypothetical protein
MICGCNEIVDNSSVTDNVDFNRIIVNQNSVSVEGDYPLVYVSSNHDTVVYSIDRYNRPYFESIELDPKCILRIDTIVSPNRNEYFIVENSMGCKTIDLEVDRPSMFEYSVFAPLYKIEQGSYLYSQGFNYLETPAVRNLHIHISCSNQKKCIELVKTIIELID